MGLVRRRHIDVKTVEVTRPEIDAQLIAEDIAEQLEKRASFRRTMKQAMQRAMEGGAKGVKLQLSGRLGGAEMARCEKGMEGSIPLSTLRCKVEYGFSEAATPQGNIGIKVWVNQGDYLTGDIADATDTQVGPSQKRRGPRRGGNLGNIGAQRVKPTQGSPIDARSIGRGQAPPGYQDALREFSRRIDNLDTTPPKK